MFDSIRALTRPYAAPSVLHIAVVLAVGPPLKLAPRQTQTPKKWAEIESFQVHTAPSQPVLRPKRPKFVLAAHAQAKHASRRAACSQSTGAVC